jgi:spermidine synthase
MRRDTLPLRLLWNNQTHFRISPMAKSPNDYRFALVLLGFNGAVVLGHQILWTRRLTDLIGAGAFTTARVFGCFFLGLALGAAASRAVIGANRHPWRVAGCIELGIALFSLPLLMLPTWTGSIWTTLGPERLVAWQGLLIKDALSVLLICPPSFLMGITLPLVTAAVCKSGSRFAAGSVYLYAVHTIGGAAGLLLVVGVALQVLGATGSILLMMGLTIALALACFSYDWILVCRGKSAPQVFNDLTTGQGVHLPWQVYGLAFLSGAGILGLEILSLELLKLKTPVAFYPPAAVLFCVVALLALAAAVTPKLCQRLGGPTRTLGLCLAGGGVAIAAAPLVFMSTTTGHGVIIVPGMSLDGSLLRLLGVTLLSVGLPVLLAGITFPTLLCWHDGTGFKTEPWELGRLLAMNGIGGVVGAEFACRVLLPGLGVHGSFGMLGIAYCLGAAALVLAHRDRRIEVWIAPLAGVAVCVLLQAKFLSHLPLFLRASTFEVLNVSSSREGTLAVVERADIGRAMIFDNLYQIGSTQATSDMEREAHVPLLLHPAPRRVGFIGLGTGITAAGALRHEPVQSIRVVELCSLVHRAAASYFSDVNLGICSHPKARIEVEDARTFFLASKNSFEVIVGDLFIPWRPGEAQLCSLEQFTAARAALAPGGVFCQWLPMFQLTAEQFQTIVATFKKAFGEVHLFRSHFKTKSIAIALVGFKDGRLDWDTVARRCESERKLSSLPDPVCRYPEGLAMLYLGKYISDGPWDGPLNTLGNLRVELAASRQLMAGNPLDYFHGATSLWLDFLERQVAATRSDIPDALRAYPTVGLLATRWEIAQEMGDPSAPTIRRRLEEAIPQRMKADLASDGSFWPGRMPLVP